MYFSLLVKRPDRLEDRPAVARAIIAILKVSTVPEAKLLITQAGGGNFAKGQVLVNERIHVMAGGSAPTIEFYYSVLNWQKETGINLGIIQR